MIATTPVGSGTEKLKYGPATGFADPATCANLSAQPAYQTQRSMASSTTRSAAPSAEPLGRCDLGGELLAPAFEHLGER